MKKPVPGQDGPSPRRRHRRPDQPAPAGGPFAPGTETAVAMILLARWLPQLVRRFEAEVKAMGLEITRREMEVHEDGTVVPVIHLRCKGDNGTVVLKLRNALDDFLCIDRDAKPAKLDGRLADEGYAERKLAAVIEARLGIVRAIAEARTPEEFHAKVEALAKNFDTFRLVRFDRAGE